MEIRDVCSAWRDCDLTNIILLENEHCCRGIFICTYLVTWLDWMVMIISHSSGGRGEGVVVGSDKEVVNGSCALAAAAAPDSDP